MDTVLEKQFTLNDGARIPALGLGTWMIDDSKVESVVREALSIGYRHIDTAYAYGNERGVGKAVRESGIPRDRIFVTTKIAAEAKDYRSAIEMVDSSLSRSGLDYFDLILIHSPQPWSDFHSGRHYFEGNLEAWRALEDARKEGKVRSIGVSNFEKEDIDNIVDNCTVRPAVNQLLAHISNTPFENAEYSEGKGMLVEAYSPIAHGEILRNETIAKVALRYGVSAAQVCIRYCLQLGMLPLPKTESRDHLLSDTMVDFEISPEDMALLKGMDRIHDYGAYSHFPVFSK